MWAKVKVFSVIQTLSKRSKAVNRFLMSAFLPFALYSENALSLTIEDTAHLLGRTGFGLSSTQWGSYKELDRQASVDFLLKGQQTTSGSSVPEFATSDIYRRLFASGTTKPEKRKLRKEFVRPHRIELQQWWWQELLTTQSPLIERMVLFWHGHFTSDVRKAHAPFGYEQNQLFRENALGDFKTLLRGVIKGAAMQLYLDNTKNRKGRPNENLARELLELYTLGEGHYTETDVREVARALTGWKVNPNRSGMQFKARHHDAGEKVVLGKKGQWAMDDIIDILLKDPNTAEFITRKLWIEFISPDPVEAEVIRLAQTFRSSDYDIAKLISGLLNTHAFWSEENRFALVKSPVELAVGAMRDYSIHIDDVQKVINQVAASGQQLFYPPDVKGWRGHTSWLSSEYIVRRQDLLTFLFRREGRSKRTEKMKNDVADSVDRDWAFYGGLVADDSTKSIVKTSQRLKAILLNDFYQLK